MGERMIIGYTDRGLPVFEIRGADDDPPKNDPPKNDPPKAPELTDDQKAAVTTEVQRVAAKIRDEATEAGKKAASEELAAALGMSVDDAKKILEDHKAAEDAKKDEATKAREAAEAERTTAATEAAAAKATTHRSNVERLLFLAGVRIEGEDIVAKASALSNVAKLVDVEVGADDAKIVTAIETLKGQFPALFTSDEDANPDPTKRSTNSDPKGKPNPPKGGADGIKRGEERYERMRKAQGAGGIEEILPGRQKVTT